MNLYNKQRRNEKKESDYFPLIGDPCYKFNRLSKETFLKNKSCAFLFVQANKIL